MFLCLCHICTSCTIFIINNNNNIIIINENRVQMSFFNRILLYYYSISQCFVLYLQGEYRKVARLQHLLIFW